MSTKQCKKAYNKFINDFSDYDIDVLLCAFSKEEYDKARGEINEEYTKTK
jgi:hypothetical protein